MAHYAFIDENNVVVEVIAGKNEGEDNTDWEIEYAKFRPGLRCKRTSYNTRAGVHHSWINSEYVVSPDQSKAFRKNYAGIGYIYDEQRDMFYLEKPFNSWTLNETRGYWEPPTQSVELTEEEENSFVTQVWNEELLTWEKKIQNSEGELVPYNSI
tara:strand:- start:4183 stop:4647 length:465 start_codon:yes stop_codon:yes gene_type:complete